MSFPQQTERWNQRFSGDDYHFGTEPNAFLASQAPRLRPGMSALSVADGEGRNSVWLARHGLRVTAFDISPVGVDKARRLALSTPTGEISNAVTRRPWRASQTLLRPSPSATESALMPGRSRGACEARKAFGSVPKW